MTPPKKLTVFREVHRRIELPSAQLCSPNQLVQRRTA